MRSRRLAAYIGVGGVAVFVVVSMLMAGAKEPAPPRVPAPRVVEPEGDGGALRSVASSPSAVTSRPAGLPEAAPPREASETKRADRARSSAEPPTLPASRPQPTKLALSPGSLPPLMAPSPPSEARAQGPPPGVLWLSGVVQGNPKLAVIRRGEERFLVREGDTVGGVYRVSRIASGSVTLRRGRRTLVLRIGQVGQQ